MAKYKPMLAAACAGALMFGPGARAQDDGPSPYPRALAAGYRALMTCGALFNGGRSEKQIETDEMKRFAPEFQPIIDTLTSKIDREAKTVTVAYNPSLPPRIAFWRTGLGCVQLPIGADLSMREQVPRLPADLTPPDYDDRAWPVGDRAATARPKGDKRALERLIDKAFDRRTYGQGTETTAVLIVQDGKIVAERYREDFHKHMSQRTWSAAKSMNAVILGVAVQQGKFDVYAPANIPEWKAGDPRAKLTTDQILRMSSGLNNDDYFGNTYPIYLGGTALTELGTAQPITYPPGTHFSYSNIDAMLAARSLRAALGDGQEALAFPLTQLFWKIGMTRTVPETDWRGNFLLSSQVWSTARDFARLGILLLNDGIWEGERLIPADWDDYLVKEGPAQPETGNRLYGAAFWKPRPTVGLPPDTYSALGFGGQMLVVIPSRRIAIVRRGYDGMGFPSFLIDDFVRDALKVLE